MILDRIENAAMYAGLNTIFTAEHAETADGPAMARPENYKINSACSANSAVKSVVNARFAKAFEVLRDTSLPEKKDGKYPVDGDDIYYTIQRYTTKPLLSPQRGHCEAAGRSNLEAHRKYIDIQFLLAGEELLGYAPLDDLAVAKEYNPQKDIAFYHTPKEITKVKLEPGLFCMLFPSDAHLPALAAGLAAFEPRGEVSPLGGPCCQIDGPSEVLKVVIKVRL